MTRYYRPIALLVSLPMQLAPFLRRSTGSAYGVGLAKKLVLLFKMVANNVRIQSASNFLEHLAMATTILNLPPSVDGSVVECGAYKGGSTTNLSLVCALCNRRLEVFDSFAGLPEPTAADRAHVLIDRGELHTYTRGAWAGTLEEVRRTIERYGAIDVCTFHVGYFDETLPDYRGRCVLVFADVDLAGSLASCLRYLWPLLADEGYFYTHEATHMEIASMFFDRDWWESNLGCAAPGLVGAGTGLGLIPAAGGFRSSIGYTAKTHGAATLEEVPQPGLEVPAAR